MKKKLSFRIPIFIKLLSFSCIIVIVITSAIGFLVLNVQKKQFKLQLIDFGKSFLHIIEKNAPDKILAEEDMALFKLVKDIAENEQIVRVIITNKKNNIIAHNDIDQVNIPYLSPRNLIKTSQLQNGPILSTFLENNQEFLFLEIPLNYQNVGIGRAHLVISQKIIEKSIALSKQYILFSFVVIILLAFLASLGFSIYFSRPIKKLENSVVEFGTGNYKHRAKITRNDELGDLADTFNRMAEDIELKEKIKDSFGRYVSPDIVEMVLSNPSGLWLKAASIQATVLYTDIRGFTSLSENKAPEAVVEMLNDHFTQITEIIIRHGGHIDKFVGDAAMAVFGITREATDHAGDAVRAALEIMAEIESLARESLDAHNALKIGIGINTGNMVAGNLGSKQKMEFTVIGDNVNIASRLTSLADPGEILISGTLYDGLQKDGTMIIKEKGQVSIKGKKNKIRVFSLEELPLHKMG